MQLKVSEKGVYDANGKVVPVGHIFEVKGDKIPAFLVNKVIDMTPVPEEADAEADATLSAAVKDVSNAPAAADKVAAPDKK